MQGAAGLTGSQHDSCLLEFRNIRGVGYPLARHRRRGIAACVLKLKKTLCARNRYFYEPAVIVAAIAAPTIFAPKLVNIFISLRLSFLRPGVCRICSYTKSDAERGRAVAVFTQGLSLSLARPGAFDYTENSWVASGKK